MKLDIDITHRQGEFTLELNAIVSAGVTGVFGRSGTGKSTLLHAIAGLLRPDSGRIVLDGQTLYDSDGRVNVPVHRRRVGVVFQDARLFPHRSVRGNLHYALNHTPRKERRFELPAIADMLEIAPLLNRPVANLSGGEKQRVALARAILGSPRLLLLDEPLAALDDRLRRQIIPFLRRVHEETRIPMLHVSHDLSEILSLTDRLMLLHGGRLAGHDAFPALARSAAALELMHQQGLVNALPLTVTGHAPDRGLTLLEPMVGSMSGNDRHESAPRLRGPFDPSLRPGQDVQAILRPTDVSLAQRCVEQISIQNQIPGRVSRVHRLPGQTLCLVEAAVPLLVEVTHQTVREMNLHPGREVWCLFKTQALNVFSVTGPGADLDREQAHPASAGGTGPLSPEFVRPATGG